MFKTEAALKAAQILLDQIVATKVNFDLHNTGAAEEGGHLPTQFSAKSCNEYLVCERKKLTCNPNCMLDF